MNQCPECDTFLKPSATTCGCGWKLPNIKHAQSPQGADVVEADLWNDVQCAKRLLQAVITNPTLSAAMQKDLNRAEQKFLNYRASKFERLAA